MYESEIIYLNGNPIKRAEILTRLKKDKAHIAFLQETNFSDEEHVKLKRLGFKQFLFIIASTAHNTGKTSMTYLGDRLCCGLKYTGLPMAYSSVGGI